VGGSCHIGSSVWPACVCLLLTVEHIAPVTEVNLGLSVGDPTHLCFAILFMCGQNPIVSCLMKIQNGLTFLLPAYPSCPGKSS